LEYLKHSLPIFLSKDKNNSNLSSKSMNIFINQTEFERQQQKKKDIYLPKFNEYLILIE
jgi:hypothetical protein